MASHSSTAMRTIIDASDWFGSLAWAISRVRSPQMSKVAENRSRLSLLLPLLFFVTIKSAYSIPQQILEDVLKVGVGCKKTHKAYAEIGKNQHFVSEWRAAYPNDLTLEQWELIAEMFPEAKTGGRPRTTAIYALMNAIVYVLCQGCTWRALPGDFPPWSTVYGYFRRWQKDGTWLKVHDKLYQWVRVTAGREPSPSEVAVDSQSVETATMIHAWRGLRGR